MARLHIEDKDRGKWVFHDDDAPTTAVRITILLGGSPPPEERIRAEAARGRALVCANGGYKVAMSAGLSPDMVVGDLDSLPKWAHDKLPETAVHRDPSQNDNDLEKAVRQALRRWGPDAELVLLGAGGDHGRVDHAIANLGVLLTEPHRRIQQVDAEGRLIALRTGKLHLEDAVGAMVSVLPWSLHGAVISEVGLHFPLDEERLQLGGRGISNEVGDDTALVEVHEGVALVWIGV
jgi:thiamine pyrophosphokinase